MKEQLVKAVSMCRTKKEQEQVMKAILETLKIEKGSAVYNTIFK